MKSANRIANSKNQNVYFFYFDIQCIIPYHFRTILKIKSWNAANSNASPEKRHYFITDFV